MPLNSPPSWRDVSAFFRFATYSIVTGAAVYAGWTTLGLPMLASQAYVNERTQKLADNNLVLQSQMNGVRLQLNKMNRQSLEREKYRLEKEPETLSNTRRLKDIEEELADTIRERNILLSPRN